MERKETILLASTTRVLSGIICRSLRSIGYKAVLQAKDGKDALHLSNEARTDIVFVDWDMSELAVPEFLAEIRRNPNYSDTPVLIGAFQPSLSAAEEFVQDGIISVIKKPFDPQELDAALAKLCPPAPAAAGYVSEADMYNRLAAAITRSTESTFETMAFTKLEHDGPKLRMDIEGLPVWYSASIGVNGTIDGLEAPLRGNVSLAFAEGVAESTLRSMMMADQDTSITMEEVQDAVGELANMAVGSAKAEAQEAGINYMITLPSVVVGQRHRVPASEKNLSYSCDMKCDAGNVVLNMVFL